jgi:hypothetical protein
MDGEGRSPTSLDDLDQYLVVRNCAMISTDTREYKGRTLRHGPLFEHDVIYATENEGLGHDRNREELTPTSAIRHPIRWEQGLRDRHPSRGP